MCSCIDFDDRQEHRIQCSRQFVELQEHCGNMAFEIAKYTGILHHFVGEIVLSTFIQKYLRSFQSQRLVAFEYHNNAKQQNKNLILFVGGLNDGLNTVPYVPAIASALPPTWSLAQTLLSSSYGGWGSSSIQADADEIADCVAYFRNIYAKDGKIVLMGHSTGCQDSLWYLTGNGHEHRPAIDGVILQAPASDRECLQMLLSKTVLDYGVELAREMIADGRGSDFMPAKAIEGFFPAPVCARRWLSLLSPDHGSDEDMFSSDLQTELWESRFGAVPHDTQLCILYSEMDQYVPDFVDREALVQRWIGIATEHGVVVDTKNSGLLEGANHNVSNNQDALGHLLKRVIAFLKKVEGYKNPVAAPCV